MSQAFKDSGRNFKQQLYRIVFIPVVALIVLLILNHWQNLFLNDSLKQIIELNEAHAKYSEPGHFAAPTSLALAKKELSNFFFKDESWRQAVGNVKSPPALLQLLKEKKDAQQAHVAHFERLGLIVEVFLGFGMTFFVALLVFQEVNKLTFDYRNLLKENQDSMEALKEASRSKDLFLANLSHEFRTPLGAIIGFADLLDRDRTLSPEGKGQLFFIRRNGRHLLNLMNDLFDLSKVVAHKIDVYKEEIKLEDFILDIEELFSYQIELKKIDFHVSVSKRIPRLIYSDATRMKQIVSNLIGNALKFTPHNARIDLVFSSYDNTLHIDVIDQGSGIAPSKQEIIFESFMQGCDSVNKSEGAGLGLAISQKMAQLLGGKVELIFSKKNVGSHFRFSIPFNRHDETQLEAPAGQEQIRRDFNFAGKKILLAEDSKENQILFELYLKLSQVQLKIVENGEQAVREAMREDYDLILMDIQMPELDGYGAVKLLRDANYQREIVALTAHSFKGEKEKCLMAGFSDYLTKPVTQTAFLSKIDSLINVPA